MLDVSQLFRSLETRPVRYPWLDEWHWFQVIRNQFAICFLLTHLRSSRLTALFGLANLKVYFHSLLLWVSKLFIEIYTFEVFVNNTNLTFQTFLYKINMEMSLKNKVASNENCTHNWPSLQKTSILARVGHLKKPSPVKFELGWFLHVEVIYICQIWLTYREKSDFVNSANIANAKCGSLELRGT